MSVFSKRSQEKLITCDKRLQDLFNAVLQEFDCTIVCGHRGKEAQDAAVKAGTSKTPYPKSKHNYIPSLAVDVVPYPIDWDNIERFKELNKVVIQKAKVMGINVEWGGEWKMRDYPHYQLKS